MSTPTPPLEVYPRWVFAVLAVGMLAMFSETVDSPWPAMVLGGFGWFAWSILWLRSPMRDRNPAR